MESIRPRFNKGMQIFYVIKTLELYHFAIILLAGGRNMSHAAAMLKHRIKKLFYFQNIKIAFYILFISIVTGILLTAIAGFITQPGNKSSISPMLDQSSSMDSNSKDNLKSRFDGLGADDKEALKAQAKAMLGK